MSARLGFRFPPGTGLFRGQSAPECAVTSNDRIILGISLGVLLVCAGTSLTAEDVAEKTVGKASEKAAEKLAEKAEEKAKERAHRPEEWRGPTKVHFFVLVLDIDNIDGAAQSFAANFYIRLRWKDERLAKSRTSMRQIPLEEVWNPRLLLANQQGTVRMSLPEVVEVSPDGTVIYRQRYNGTLSQPLVLSQFPLDQHRFTIQFVAAGYAAHELEFVPDVLIREEGIAGGAFQTSCRCQTGR
jgi:hypothetical protein